MSMTRPWVSRIESNVKGGVSTDLGPKTVIVGPNGSGKSAIINAVELALTGRASDLAGRAEVAREADLLSLAPGREGHLFAAAKLSDGTLAEYRTEGSTAKAKKATHKVSGYVDADHVLPLRAVTEAIRGSADTARKFFLRQVSSTVTDAQVVAQIPAALRTLYTAAAGPAILGSTPVDRLLIAKEHAAKAAREAKARVKAGREAASAAAAGLPPPPSSQEIEAVQKAARDAKKALMAAVAAEQQKDLRAKLVEAEAQLVEAAGVVQVAEGALTKLPKPMALTDVQRTAVAALKQICKAGHDNCFTCGTQGIGKEKFAARAATVDKLLADESAKQQVIAAAEAALNTAKLQQLHAEASVRNIRALIKEVPADVGDIESAEKTLEHYEKDLAALLSARAAWDVAQRANDVGESGNGEAERWSELVTACGVAVEQILDGALATFVAKVQTSLPHTDVFNLNLRDGEREVCQVGLLRSGVLHTALSGAEWARVTAALAVACAPAQGPSIIIPEERAFDPFTLEKVCMAMTNIDGQVIIASPVAPAVVLPGWTIVKTGRTA